MCLSEATLRVVAFLTEGADPRHTHGCPRATNDRMTNNKKKKNQKEKSSRKGDFFSGAYPLPEQPLGNEE